MIKTKKELKFYIWADRIMSGLPLRSTIKERLSYLVSGGDKIIRFQLYMRNLSYYKNLPKRNAYQNFRYWYYKVRYVKISIKLGFSIGPDVFGYGLYIPHYGTIVINNDARVGNFAVVHTCTNIAGGKRIGNGLYLSTGSQLVGDIVIGDNVTVASNSLVNKSYGNNLLIGGVPAKVLKEEYLEWYIRDGKEFFDRVNYVNKLKVEMGIEVTE